MSRRRRLTKRQLKAIRRDESLREGNRAPIRLAGQKLTPILSDGKRDHIVKLVSDVLRDWRDNRWEGEAAARHGLRVGLVLQGHAWQTSDDAAADVIRRAFNLLGRGKETRPDKEEGQPYHSYPRENCKWCYGPIAEEDMTGGRSRTFCSDHCARAAYVHWDMRNALNGSAIEREAYRAVYRDQRPERQCDQCGKSFRLSRDKAETRFCSLRCSAEARRLEIPQRACEQCGEMFRPPSSNLAAKFCGKACADEAKRIFQPKPCRWCEATFIPKREDQFFCSQACAHEGKKLREVERTCQFCGDTFTATRADADYCSKACHRSAFRINTGRVKRLSAAVFDYLFFRDQPQEAHPIQNLFDRAA